MSGSPDYFSPWGVNPGSFAFQNLIGQDKWNSDGWLLTRTGWTDVGTPTVTQRFRFVGHLCEFQVKVVPGTTIATVAGTSYFNLPVTAMGLSGMPTVMTDITAFTAAGVCVIDITNSRCYVPSQVASGNTFTIAGSYEV